MRFVPGFRRAFRVVVVALGVLLASASARAEDVTIDGLLAKFHALPGLEAKYRDEQHLSLLARPLVSEGTLHFAPPERLARHTLKPAVSSAIIDGHTVTFGTATKKESIDLAGNPIAKLFVETFLHVLSGDRAWLEQSYGLVLKAGTDGAWTLALTPKTAPMNGLISTITLSGKGIVIERMKLVETSGDDTVTTFTDVNPAKHWTEVELDRTFRMPAGKP